MLSEVRKSEYVQRLKDAQNDADIERAHQTADCIICDILIDLGYSDIVDEYDSVNKWYA